MSGADPKNKSVEQALEDHGFLVFIENEEECDTRKRSAEEIRIGEWLRSLRFTEDACAQLKEVSERVSETRLAGRLKLFRRQDGMVERVEFTPVN